MPRHISLLRCPGRFVVRIHTQSLPDIILEFVGLGAREALWNLDEAVLEEMGFLSSSEGVVWGGGDAAHLD